LVSRTEQKLVSKVQEVVQISNPPRPRTITRPTRILIIEDNFALRDILRLTLSKRGFEVIEAIDALMALEFLETTSHQPDLILLDLMMPRLDGFGFVEQIRAMPNSASIPIIVVTAKPLTTAEHERLRNKVDDILYKGIYSQNDLLRRIDQLITVHTGQILAAE
jgi:CheY-like chemotaxis protein